MAGMNQILQRQIDMLKEAGQQEKAEADSGEPELMRKIKEAKPSFDEQIGLKPYVPDQLSKKQPKIEEISENEIEKDKDFASEGKVQEEVAQTPENGLEESREYILENAEEEAVEYASENGTEGTAGFETEDTPEERVESPYQGSLENTQEFSRRKEILLKPRIYSRMT